MLQDIFLIEFNQDADNIVSLINIDRVDSVAARRSQTMINFGRDESGWRLVGWAHSQQEAHDLAETFLHKYYAAHPDRFPTKAAGTSNFADDRRRGYDPNLRLLPRQTYK